MGGDKIPGPLDALRDEMTLGEKWALHDVMKCIRRVKADLEELGVDVKVVIKDTPPDTPRGVVLHLTAIIRKELEEG